MSNKLSIADLDVQDKRVLMRVDYNVPMDNGQITDTTRIAATLPSIQNILSRGGSLILMSHLGRPNGTKNQKYSLAPCAEQLTRLLGMPVQMAPDCIGPRVENLVKSLKPGQILLLENLRFYPAEEDPQLDPSFAKHLASYGDVYVNDAFGTAHRSHSSTTEVPKYFPGKAAAGFLMEKEIHFLGNLLINTQGPFYAIIGGAKISTKLGALKALLKRADGLLIGGGMAYTFLKAQGIPIGNSIHEDLLIDEALAILHASREYKFQLLLPKDLVIADKLSNDAIIKIIDTVKGVPSGFQGVDIGPKTIQEYVHTIKDAKTIFWNGPMGVFEVSAFAQGTKAIAEALAHSSATTIVGGGESVAALEQLQLVNQISHVSTGGGASLEYLEDGTLPGIDALSESR